MKTNMKPNAMRMGSAILGCAFYLLSFPVVAGQMEKDFVSPPEEMKPWCYWYWMNNDVTAEGITKDLEAMAHTGIKLAMIGNIEGGGPVKMFSPEWYKLTRHALKEAHRVGVDIMMFNAPGWSQTGGPWVKPEQSMRRVIWNEVQAPGGKFSARVRNQAQEINMLAFGESAGKVRHEPQDIAVLAVPRKNAVKLTGVARPVHENELTFAACSWIWHASEDGAKGAPAATRYFRRVIKADPAELKSASVMAAADNSYVLWVNGKEVKKSDDWKKQESVSILEHLKPGANIIAIAATNHEEGPAGMIAAVGLEGKDGKLDVVASDGQWHAGTTEAEGWKTAEQTPADWLATRVLGPATMGPWGLSTKSKGGNALCFRHTAPFVARSLAIQGEIDSKLYAVTGGKRELVAEIKTGGRNPTTDFLPDGLETFSFKDTTAQEFVLEPCELDGGKVALTSEPVVAQVIEKQLGRLHPTPSPTWESYIFPDSVEPGDAKTVVRKNEIINLTDKIDKNGVLTCELPAGDWTILYFGMVSTGKVNSPAPAEATGLEVDKMSKSLVEHHFNSMFGKLLKEVTPEEKSAWVGITIDSYEKGAQNWTDHFDKEFKKRNGYDPIAMLPVFTGRVVESAKASDRFLWDLRRTVADMIGTEYVTGLRDISHKHGMRLWCENYGHWGFPGEFLIYGRYADEIGGEFWTNMDLGPIECRAASSAAHIYGKRRVYGEAFTSSLDLNHHPYAIKARGEQLFCEGINHFVLHVYAHQPRDGAPGKNPWFGTPFHRNTPWFNQAGDWVTYLQRMHYMLQQGESAADVAVYIGDFAPQMTGPANPVPGGYDYDYVSSDALLDTVKLVDGEWVVYDEKNPEKITSRYKLLALPQAGHIRPHVAKRIEALKKAGGKTVDAVPVTAEHLKEAGIAPVVTDTSCPIRWKARKLDDGMIFFLSNFGQTGKFEATLRVKGKSPELYNPATGKITKLARYQAVDGGTRISIDVKNNADSFFVVCRDKPSRPSVVKVESNGADVSPADLALYYDAKGVLTAESARKGSYTLTMSDASQGNVVIDQDQTSLSVAGPWTSTNQDATGHTVMMETSVNVPADFGKNRRTYLDLGQVSIMAKVKLNGKEFETLWMPPFVLDVTGALKPGDNKLQVLVTSTSNGKPKLGDAVALKAVPVSTVK